MTRKKFTEKYLAHSGPLRGVVKGPGAPTTYLKDIDGRPVEGVDGDPRAPTI
jgi:hypothetical protein